MRAWETGARRGGRKQSLPEFIKRAVAADYHTVRSESRKKQAHLLELAQRRDHGRQPSQVHFCVPCRLRWEPCCCLGLDPSYCETLKKETRDIYLEVFPRGASVIFERKKADFVPSNKSFKRILLKTAMKNTSVPPMETPKVRIAVLGKVNVGKSALTVRYLTRRFIGEYRSKTDLLYRQIMTINNTPLEVEIVDVSGGDSDDENDVFPAEEVAWADGCLVVYSITDRESFEYAEETLRRLRPNENNSGSDSESVNNLSNNYQQPLVLLGNKADLEHLRQVQGTEGRMAASKLCRNAKFYEVSVAENSKDLYAAFEALITECSTRQRRSSGQNGLTTFANDNNNNSQNGNNHFQVTSCNNQNLIQAQPIKVQRKFSVSKMIGNLIGKSVGNGGGGGGGNPQQQVSGGNFQQVQNQPLPQPQGGTVTVFQKSDLHRSRVLKRRNNCAPASASL